MNKLSIKVEGLAKTYGGQTVVKHISFGVKKGEVFGLLEPNGAGKTTALEMIEALRPTWKTFSLIWPEGDCANELRRYPGNGQSLRQGFFQE